MIRVLVAIAAIVLLGDPTTATLARLVRAQRSRPTQNAGPRSVKIIKAQPVEPELAPPLQAIPSIAQPASRAPIAFECLWMICPSDYAEIRPDNITSPPGRAPPSSYSTRG